jgi:hypothetical protein
MVTHDEIGRSATDVVDVDHQGAVRRQCSASFGNAGDGAPFRYAGLGLTKDQIAVCVWQFASGPHPTQGD